MAHLYPYLDAPTPLGFAHRGGAGGGVENSVAAFARAVDLGYRYLETDVRATADGVAVIFHDDTLDRVFGRRGRVGELRWADLASLRDGGATVVPRLDGVLDGWPELRFNIDAKSDVAVGPIVDAVRWAAAEDQVLLASFSDARLARLRRMLGPRVATSMGVRAVARLWAAARCGRRLCLPPGVVAAQVPWRFGHVPVVTRPFIRYCHRLGLQVHVWTVDDPTAIGQVCRGKTWTGRIRSERNTVVPRGDGRANPGRTISDNGEWRAAVHGPSPVHRLFTPPTDTTGVLRKHVSATTGPWGRSSPLKSPWGVG